MLTCRHRRRAPLPAPAGAPGGRPLLPTIAARMLALHRWRVAQFIECAVPPQQPRANVLKKVCWPIWPITACAGRRSAATAHEPAHLQPPVPCHRRHEQVSRGWRSAWRGRSSCWRQLMPTEAAATAVRPGSAPEPAPAVSRWDRALRSGGSSFMWQYSFSAYPLMLPAAIKIIYYLPLRRSKHHRAAQHAQVSPAGHQGQHGALPGRPPMAPGGGGPG